jgi:prophage regulatory protein
VSIASTGLGKTGRKIVRISGVVTKTGLSRSTLWRLTKAGSFPAPVTLAARAVGWFDDEIDAYLEARAAEREAR